VFQGKAEGKATQGETRLKNGEKKDPEIFTNALTNGYTCGSIKTEVYEKA